mmetsp:Transcript_12551/g.29821  ORF Transcript_12551/g.29821 Transcript_12551/m.29821 type:complete len:147 (+) Transcript_12551:140-580(+)
MGDKLAPNERHSYVHNGQVVYEWDQTLSEVNVYFQVPAGVTAKLIYCEISRKHLRLGIKPNPPYLDLDLFSTVQVDDSFWTLDGCNLQVCLEKASKVQVPQLVLNSDLPSLVKFQPSSLAQSPSPVAVQQQKPVSLSFAVYETSKH